MSTSENIELTPEVTMESKTLYLVRVDGEELAFVDSEDEAKLVVDSVAASEQKRLENDWTKVFRQDLDEGCSVAILTQSLGFFVNGGIVRAVYIDYTSVGHAILTKGRHELPKEGDVSTPVTTSIPVSSVLEKIAKRLGEAAKKTEEAKEARDAKEAKKAKKAKKSEETSTKKD